MQKSKMKYVVAFITFLACVASAFAIFNIFLLQDIENTIRYVVMGTLGLISLILIIRTRARFKAKKKKMKNGFFITFMIFYIVITALIGLTISYLYGTLSGMNREYTLFSSSLVTMYNSDIENPQDVTNMRIAILEDEDSPEGYIIPRLIIDEYDLENTNEFIEYYDFAAMIADLYSNEIDAIFVPTAYTNMFNMIELFDEIESDTKIIVTREKRIRREEVSRIATASLGRDINEPFTILLMGIDEVGEELERNAANGDTLMLLTFNPATLNATMLSVPRDTFMPIACWRNQRENKITHAASHGKDCVIDSLENFFDITIDYYAMINFVGLVRLVDAVGGIEVDVPRRLCTDNSNRELEVCIHPGRHRLNGEEALVFARNRYDMPRGDLDRNIHQQEIIMALSTELRNATSFSAITEILNTISMSLDTNITTQQMLGFYNIARDIMATNVISDDLNIINIQQMFLEGHGQMIFDEAMRMTLWNYVPNEESRQAITSGMKQNLGLEEREIIKEFSFSINDPFERPVIGQGNFRSVPRSNYVTVPNFIGLSEADARFLANRHGIRWNFVGNGLNVISQSISAGSRLDLTNGSITLTLGGGTQNTPQGQLPNDNTGHNNTQPDEDDEIIEPPIELDPDPDPDPSPDE